MDYRRDWEEKIKQTLEAATPEEAGYSANSEDIWNQLCAKNQRPKSSLLSRLVVSHIAAAILGILLSTLAYFLLFQPLRPEQVVSVTTNIQEQPAKKPETRIRGIEKPAQPVQETTSPGLNKQKVQQSKRIASHKQHELNNHQTQKTKASPKFSKDTIPEYAATNLPEQQLLVDTLMPPQVVYWSEIKDNYQHKSEPKYWAKLMHKVNRRLEKEDMKNNKAPAVVWIQTFK